MRFSFVSCLDAEAIWKAKDCKMFLEQLQGGCNNLLNSFHNRLTGSTVSPLVTINEVLDKMYKLIWEFQCQFTAEYRE